MKTIFFGTPAIAVPFLERLQTLSQIAAVVTSPDQPAGRGYDIKLPEVKQCAQKLGLPVLQPEKASDPDFLKKLQDFQAEVGIVVAYGKLLPIPVLKATKHGMINIHFSLLPAYRGAAPIQWALINGESETGVTLFWLDEGMDTGPIFLQQKVAVGDSDAEGLRQRLVTLGVEMLQEAVDLLKTGKKKSDPQIGLASRAPMLKKEDGELDWSQSAQALSNRLRGTTPWPGAYTVVSLGGNKTRLKILRARPLKGAGAAVPGTAVPGTVLQVNAEKGVVVKCGIDWLALEKVQPEGKKAMEAFAWWQGSRLQIGDRIGS